MRRVALAVCAGIALAGCTRAQDASPAIASSTVATPAGAFQSSIETLTPTQARWMTGITWHPGCPVAIEDLRLLQISYYDFSGAVVQGRMVANQRVAADLVQVFNRLYDARFPLERVDAPDLYPPAERPTKRRNISIGFNCRDIAGTDTWSQHAYGLAVDINPTQNPWVDDHGKVVPRVGSPYVDRTQELPGMIHPGDVVVTAFAEIGWRWGGDWSSPKDYMHFSLSGG
jgi:hypothetical protein